MQLPHFNSLTCLHKSYIYELCNKDNIDEREKYWIQTLNTLFPYSLNDRADFGDFHNVRMEVTDKNCTHSTYAAFPKVNVERRKRGNHLHDNDNDNDTNCIFSRNISQRLKKCLYESRTFRSLHEI